MAITEAVGRIISALVLAGLKVTITAGCACWILNFPPFDFTFKEWFSMMAVLGAAIEVFSFSKTYD